MMLVRYRPLTIDFAQANRQPKIQFFLRAGGPRFSTTHRGDDKSHIPAGSDLHFPYIERNRLARPGKE